MKKQIFCALIALAATTFTAAAQDAAAVPTATQDTVHTLFKHAKLHYLGLYVAPEIGYGQSSAAFTSFSGTSVMLLLNKRWGIGASGQMSLDESFSPTAVSPLQLRTAFGGAKVEYTIRPNSAIHLTIPVVFGMGEARADSAHVRSGGHDHNTPDDLDKEGDDGLRGEFLVLQPGLHLEANLFRFTKVFIGADYRFARKVGSDTNTLSANTLQGFSIGAGLKVGLFDYRIHRIRRKK